MSQTAKLFDILQDEKVHTVPELLELVYGLNKPSSARLAARVYDLRKRGKKWGFKIHSNRESGTKWWYMLEIRSTTKWKKATDKTFVERKRGNSKRVKQLN